MQKCLILIGGFLKIFFIVILIIVFTGSGLNDLKKYYIPQPIDLTRVDNTIWGRKSYTKLK